MSVRKQSSTSRDKTRKYRARLRKQGLWPVEIWVPDMRAPTFSVEAHRQSLAVAKSRHSCDDQEFIDAGSDVNSE